MKKEIVEENKLENVAGGGSYSTKSVQTHLYFSDGSLITSRMVTVSLNDTGAAVKDKIAERFSGICDGRFAPDRFDLYTANWIQINDADLLSVFFPNLRGVELNFKLRF